jgi:hypothetical protein
MYALTAPELNTLAMLVDAAHQAVLDANTTPYDHDEYERCDRVFTSAVMVYAQGDEKFAGALIEAFRDSGESVAYYLRNGHDALLADFAF